MKKVVSRIKATQNQMYSCHGRLRIFHLPIEFTATHKQKELEKKTLIATAQTGTENKIETISTISKK